MSGGNGYKKSIADVFLESKGRRRICMSRCIEYQRMISSGEWLAAVRALGEALEADSSYDGAYFNLGLAFEAGGLTQFARVAYEKYLKIAPEGYWADSARDRLSKTG